ncbi:MAG: hypothetical protein FD174_3398 [Geobacteraceae bacterium]|nr:MAG: hypothetical protein FD174_3398 [Geobacteraceae bacterium]
MTIRILKSSKGFTYLAALMIVVIMGIMLGVIGQSWQRTMKREREEELLFRGNQIRDAIVRWNTKRPGQHPPTPLRDLKDLLKDPRSMANVRYLRRLYKDPVTGKDFEVIRDPVKGVIGVRSTSEDKPLRESFQSLLPVTDQELEKLYLSFEKKEKYSDWAFVFGQLPPRGTVIQ